MPIVLTEKRKHYSSIHDGHLKEMIATFKADAFTNLEPPLCIIFHRIKSDDANHGVLRKHISAKIENNNFYFSVVQQS